MKKYIFLSLYYCHIHIAYYIVISIRKGTRTEHLYTRQNRVVVVVVKYSYITKNKLQVKLLATK